MKTPLDKTISVTYHSHQTKKLEMRWRAVLVFPPGAQPDTILAITVTDGTGAPVESGTLKLAGHQIKIANGAGTLSYRDFVAGKHEKALWLHRKGMLPVPGALTFA